MNSRGASATQVTLIVIVVAGLAVDAFVHYDLASAFKNVKTSTLSEADMFRAEATVAVIAAVAVLVRPRRYTAAFAFLVAAAGFVAVMVTRYVNVGAFGPFPNVYDPFWAPTGKWLSAVAEGIAAVAALALLWVLHTRTRSAAPANQAAVHARG